MKKMLVLCSLVVMLMGLTASSAPAALMNGAVSFAGSYTLDTGDISTATAFESFPFVVITGGSGIWADIVPGSDATFNPFTFNPGTNVTPLWSFLFDGITYSLNATAPTMVFTSGATLEGIPLLAVSGAGTIIANGGDWEPTPGAYAITANSAGTTFSFSASSFDVSAVPEPTTLILLGSGLLGLALTGAKKKFRK